MSERVLVLGGSSEIAQAVVAELCSAGAPAVVLAGRDEAALATAAQSARDAGAAKTDTILFDARETAGHARLIESARERLGGLDVVILAVGALGEPDDPLMDPAASVPLLEVNAVGAGSLLLHVASALRAQGAGTAVVLSSAGAVRPRRSNAVYGASKAALDTLALALDDGLVGSGARVLVVRPGFVRTRMTRGLRVPPLASDATDVGRATVRALSHGARIVWVPRALGWVMTVLRIMPRFVYRRLPL